MFSVAIGQMKTNNFVQRRRKCTLSFAQIADLSWFSKSAGWGTGTNIIGKMASRVKDFQNVFRNSNINERKKVLAKVLQIPEFNEEDDLRTATLIDVYYEMLSYLVNHGLPWRQVASFFEMFQCLLNETQGKQYIATGRHRDRTLHHSTDRPPS